MCIPVLCSIIMFLLLLLFLVLFVMVCILFLDLGRSRLVLKVFVDFLLREILFKNGANQPYPFSQ